MSMSGLRTAERALTSLRQKMTKKPTSPGISDKNFTMEIDEPSLVDSSGLKIRIPVLKRKRKKE
jgi:hypothetical protein